MIPIDIIKHLFYLFPLYKMSILYTVTISFSRFAHSKDKVSRLESIYYVR